MKTLPWIIVAVIIGAAMYLVWNAEQRAEEYRKQATRQYVKARVERVTEMRNLLAVIDSVQLEKEAAATLFHEYMKAANREHVLQQQTKRYESKMDSVRGLDIDGLRNFIITSAE